MATTFKIQDRLGSTRLSDKDALDVYRLLCGIPTDDLAARYRLILEDAVAGASGRASLDLLKAQFGDRRSQGVAMSRSVTIPGGPGRNGSRHPSCEPRPR